MIRINLLPHREQKRKRQQQQFLVTLGAVVALGAAFWFGGHYYLSGQLEQQQGRNAYLESEVAKLDKQIEEIKKLKESTAALLQRKKVIEALQANRAETVYLLDQLVRQLPDGGGAEADQNGQHVERSDDGNGVERRLARLLRILHGEHAHQDMWQADKAE